MATKLRRCEWFALVFTVLVGMLYAVPLAAQSSSWRGVPEFLRTPAQPVVIGAVVPETTEALLEQMSLAAGVIFAGEVTAVGRPVGFAGSGQDAAEGVVEIELRVEQSLRGPTAGSIYTLREWAGLWAGHAERFRAGQRLLLFLYAPDAHGLSAPVHGAEGAVPLRGSGVAPGPDDSTVAAAEWLVDLRWLQAQVLRKREWTLLPVREPGGPNPIRGAVPQGGERPWTERAGSLEERRGPQSDSAQLDADPMLIAAIREPRLPTAAAPIEARPLSQVLALCHEALTLDAMRRRDAGR